VNRGLKRIVLIMDRVILRVHTILGNQTRWESKVDSLKVRKAIRMRRLNSLRRTCRE